MVVLSQPVVPANVGTTTKKRPGRRRTSCRPFIPANRADPQDFLAWFGFASAADTIQPVRPDRFASSDYEKN